MSNCSQTNSLYGLTLQDTAAVDVACQAEACKNSMNPMECVGVRTQGGTCVRASRVAGTNQPAFTPNDLLGTSGLPPNVFQFNSSGALYGATQGGCNVVGVSSGSAQLAGFVPRNAGLKPLVSYGNDSDYQYVTNLSSADYNMGICNGAGDGWGGCNGSR